MGFRNSILAGLTLIREAIRSQNYEEGVEGWAINADGTAEFSDLTVRSSNGSGDTIELANGEVLVYDGGVLVGKLSASIPGLLVGRDTLPQVYVYSVAGIGRVEFDANSPAAGIRSALTMAIFGAGTPTENISLQLQGPGVTGATDRVELLLDSQNADGSSQANMVARIAAGGPNLFVFDRTGGASFVRWVVAPPAGSSSALSVQAQSGHTGALVQVSKSGLNRLLVNPDGHLSLLPNGSASFAVMYAETDLNQTAPYQRYVRDGNNMFVTDAAGVVQTYGANAFTTWTPTISGGGSATFTARDGFMQRVGKMVFVQAYFSVNAAGSGSTVVTMSLPISPWRGGVNSRRQNLPGGARDGSVAGAGPISGLVFGGGSGAVIDRIVNSAGTDVTGAMLTAGSVWTFEGWLRED